MPSTLDPTLIPALNAIERALEPRRLDRRQLLNSMQRLDWEMRLKHYPAILECDDPRDTEQFFAEEQSPSESAFR